VNRPFEGRAGGAAAGGKAGGEEIVNIWEIYGRFWFKCNFLKGKTLQMKRIFLTIFMVFVSCKYKEDIKHSLQNAALPKNKKARKDP
jgi:hypothetical protein